jgi:hypothetical protein
VSTKATVTGVTALGSISSKHAKLPITRALFLSSAELRHLFGLTQNSALAKGYRPRNLPPPATLTTYCVGSRVDCWRKDPPPNIRRAPVSRSPVSRSRQHPAVAHRENGRNLLWECNCSAALRGHSQNSNRLQLLPATLENNHVLQDGVQVGPQGNSYVVVFPNIAHYCDEPLSMRLQQCNLSIQLTHDTNTIAKAKQKRTLLRAVPAYRSCFQAHRRAELNSRVWRWGLELENTYFLPSTLRGTHHELGSR